VLVVTGSMILSPLLLLLHDVALPFFFGEHRGEIMREAMSGGRPFDVAGMKAAAEPMKGQFRAMSAYVERQLAGGGPWIAGAAPGLADIAWYMNFWFLRSALKAEMAALIQDMPNVQDWRVRVAALGHGSRSDMTTAEAIAVAAAYFEDKLGAPPRRLYYAGIESFEEFAESIGNPEIAIAAWAERPEEGALTALPQTSFAGVTGALAGAS